ncbi:hypothetical protein, partial [Achromobacter ruhlandii]|uniref:hypothetical protein n=1 Tax=Achromobacter ruhlandii TaxID=72557 RepID=UPI003B9A0BA0
KASPALHVVLHYLKLEPLVVLRHVKTPKVGSTSNFRGSVHEAAFFMDGRPLGRPPEQLLRTTSTVTPAQTSVT